MKKLTLEQFKTMISGLNVIQKLNYVCVVFDDVTSGCKTSEEFEPLITVTCKYIKARLKSISKEAKRNKCLKQSFDKTTK
jgi:hypothetical protein